MKARWFKGDGKPCSSRFYFECVNAPNYCQSVISKIDHAFRVLTAEDADRKWQVGDAVRLEAYAGREESEHIGRVGQIILEDGYEDIVDDDGDLWVRFPGEPDIYWSAEAVTLINEAPAGFRVGDTVELLEMDDGSPRDYIESNVGKRIVLDQVELGVVAGSTDEERVYWRPDAIKLIKAAGADLKFELEVARLEGIIENYKMDNLAVKDKNVEQAMKIGELEAEVERLREVIANQTIVIDDALGRINKGTKVYAKTKAWWSPVRDGDDFMSGTIIDVVKATYEPESIETARDELVAKVEKLEKLIASGRTFYVRKNSMFPGYLIDEDPKWGGKECVVIETEPVEQRVGQNRSGKESTCTGCWAPRGSAEWLMEKRKRDRRRRS